MKRCYHCGTDNLDGTEYCDECGTRIAPPSETTHTRTLESPLPPPPPHPEFDTVLPSDITWVKPAPPRKQKMTRARYQPWLTALRQWLLKPDLAPATISPFTRSANRYEIAVPLTQLFRFVHEPIGLATTTRFVGRQGELDALAARILFSEGGSFLVTGYRGVGKTSFINQVVKKLEESLPWAQSILGDTEIIDVYLTIARPVQASELMHHIIRRLYDRLVEKGIYQWLEPERKEALTLAYQRTSVNMARKLAEASERSFGFNEASLGGDVLKATVKASWANKRSRTQNYEMTFLGYDDKAAEHDIISLARSLSTGYLRPCTRLGRIKQLFTRQVARRTRLKIVFVFDELDKLEEFTAAGTADGKPVIDEILGALKNLFTTSGVSFVFVAGKDLQERWLEDVGRGDSVYESVFSYDKYLPCMWADVGTICDSLVDWSAYAVGGLSSREDAQQAFDDFKKYLAYKGRGIPRRIIRTFNEYVEWNSAYPVLVFTRQQIRRIRFFSGLQDILTTQAKQLFGDAHEEALGTQSDKRRLGVYYLVDWMLRQGAAEFSLPDVRAASQRLSAKIALAEEIAPRVIESLIKMLVEGDYLQEVQPVGERVLIGDAALDEKRYRFTARRLVEMGGQSDELDEEARVFAEKEMPLTNIGHYKLLRLLGRGGMGSVYQASDDYTGRIVAIKILADDLSSSGNLGLRLEREAQIMAALHHPNIVQFYDSGKAQGKPYIVMEYLDGLTLDKVTTQLGRLSLDVVLAIAKPVAEAMHYVHQQGFIRNDIKPNNIMLCTSGRICLIDFGITKPTAVALSKPGFDTGDTGALIGTPYFMSPEQLTTRRVDARSDVYSLGVVLYKMFTGRYPFDSGAVFEIMQAHMQEAVKPLSQHTELPLEIDELVLKCLAKEPERRFQTMAALAAELTKAARNLPPVDLASFISLVDEQIRASEERDFANTLAPSLRVAREASLIRRFPTEMDLEAVPRPPTDPFATASPKLPDEIVTIPRLVPRQPALSPGSPEKERDLLISTETPQLILLKLVDSIISPLQTAEDKILLQEKTSIGRGSENDIALTDPKVSRYHCEIVSKNGVYVIEDFNSVVGTYVNGKRLAGSLALTDNDRIQIGESVFLFRYKVGE